MHAGKERRMLRNPAEEAPNTLQMTELEKLDAGLEYNFWDPR